MTDPVHNAVLGNVGGVESEIKGGRGPWIERTYRKGNLAIARGELVALSNADVPDTYVQDSAYPWISGDANVGAVKGVALAAAAADETTVELLVFGTVNKPELKVTGAAPDDAALAALEERHIYAVG